MTKKNRKTVLATLLLPLLLSAYPAKNAASSTFVVGKSYDKTQKLDFSDTDVTSINSYYGDVGTKTKEEMKDYLYSKIAVHNADTTDGKKDFITYNDAGKWYQLTDRNWSLSPSVSEESFSFLTSSSEDASSLYLYNMYISDSSNSNKEKAFSNLLNGFGTDTSLSHVDYTAKKVPNSYIQVDKEHVWAKNHGFKVTKDGSDTFVKGAPTDLHHLVAADHNTNSAGHNDEYYGIVEDKTASDTTVVYSYLSDNTSEISGYRGKNKEGQTVFEPTDEWKGDVARCLLYMATRYSQKLDQNTQGEPYLALVDYKAGNEYEDSNDTFHGTHYGLSTYLTWNEQDPVSNYEIHRNNLIYSNVQDNRNPYIDHPEWARRVFDTAYTYDSSKESAPLQISENNNPTHDSSLSSSGSTDSSSSSGAGKEEEPKGLSTTQIIIIAAVAGVLLLIAVMILANKGRKKKKSNYTKKKKNKNKRK
ncbi:MAG: endonuclease [Bacilli bacterium]